MNTKSLQTVQTKAFAYDSKDEKAPKPKYPNTRYFQIHFEHLEFQLDEMRRNLEVMQKQIHEIHEQVLKQSSLANQSANL